VAQRLFDDQIGSRPGTDAAAAYVTTIYGIYAESLVDTAGISGTPGPYDRVIVLEAEGIFPSTHSCPFSYPCYDTGFELAYDVATSETINFQYFYDPWSRDLASPEPSVSERFRDLRQFGTPVRLAVDGQP